MQDCLHFYCFSDSSLSFSSFSFSCCCWHHNGGAENDGHENAGHASGVWIDLHGIDFDLAVLPSNRLLLRFQECSRSKSKLKTIRIYSDDHCVFHTFIPRLSIILQLQEVYATYLAAVTCILPLFWKELHTALQRNLFSNDIYLVLVLQFHVRHFQSTHHNELQSKSRSTFEVVCRVVELNCLEMRWLITPCRPLSLTGSV